MSKAYLVVRNSPIHNLFKKIGTTIKPGEIIPCTEKELESMKRDFQVLEMSDKPE